MLSISAEPAIPPSFPFHTACRIPQETKKAVLDANDEYHAIILNKESQSLTTLIIDWEDICIYKYLKDSLHQVMNTLVVTMK